MIGCPDPLQRSDRPHGAEIRRGGSRAAPWPVPGRRGTEAPGSCSGPPGAVCAAWGGSAPVISCPDPLQRSDRRHGAEIRRGGSRALPWPVPGRRGTEAPGGGSGPPGGSCALWGGSWPGSIFKNCGNFCSGGGVPFRFQF